jgi:pyruvate/2-oxoacid:ferredoxin oxidoreductase alpha subunit
MRKLAKRAKLTDEQLLHAIVQGLRPAIRTHVLMSEPANLNEALHEARLAELATDNADTPVSVSAMIDEFRASQADVRAEIRALRDNMARSRPFQRRDVTRPATPPSTGRSSSADRYRQRSSMQTHQSPSTRRQQNYTPPPQRDNYYADRNHQVTSGPRYERQQPTGNRQFNGHDRRAVTWAPSVRQPAQNSDQRNNNFQPRPTGPANKGDRPSTCFSCGKDHRGKICPAKYLICYKCGIQGHMARFCRSSL